MPLVLVPTAVIDLNESYSGLGEAACDQTLASEIRCAAGAHGFLETDLITFECFFGFSTDIQKFGRDGLHAEAHFHGLNDRLELGVVGTTLAMFAVHGLHQV